MAKNNTITAHQIVAYIAQDVVEGYGSDATEGVIADGLFREKMELPGSTPHLAKNPKREASTSPIVIISDTLKFESLKQLATFTGNVLAT